MLATFQDNMGQRDNPAAWEARVIAMDAAESTTATAQDTQTDQAAAEQR
jgi:hypothetical protein